MNSIKEKRQSEILRLFKNVEKSSLSLKEYFENNLTPICLKQYSRLKKRYTQQGIDGLEDQRHAGNAGKIKPEEIKLVHGTLAYNRNLTSEELQDELQNQWGIMVGQRRIEQIRQEFNLNRKNLAVLFLPLVTNNGATRNVDTPLGNALRYACGYIFRQCRLTRKCFADDA